MLVVGFGIPGSSIKVPNFFIMSYKRGIAAVGKDEKERDYNVVSNICLQ